MPAGQASLDDVNSSTTPVMSLGSLSLGDVSLDCCERTVGGHSVAVRDIGLLCPGSPPLSLKGHRERKIQQHEFVRGDEEGY